MVSKKSLVRMLVLVLVFGMTVVGCDNNSNSGGNGTTYDPTGVWDFSINGQNATITITGSTWTFDGPGTDYDASGTFTQSGNTGTLYMGQYTIGIATMTSNTTLMLALHSPSVITGTFNAIKRN